MSSAAPTTENTKTGRTTFADVALVSELGDLGWKVEGEGRSWKAFEQEGDKRELGPATSVKALHTMVKLAVGNLGDEPKPEKNGNGKTVVVGKSKLREGVYSDATQPILTGTENAVFEDMEAAGRELRITTMEILRLQKIQKTQQDSVEKMMEKFKDDLEFDPKLNERFFSIDVDGENVEIVYETKETHSVKTRKAKA